MAYQYKRAISFNRSRISGSHTNFPVLISGTYPFMRTLANGGKLLNSSGHDFNFYSDVNLTTALSFELESHNTTTGQFTAWVKLPTISASSDTVIYMAYGDSGISTSQATATSVWDSNYKMVYHLGNGSSLGLSDSTSAGLTLTNNSSVTASSGQIYGGAYFNASGNYLSRTTSLPSITTTFTGQAWIYYTGTFGGTDNSFGQIVGRTDTSAGTVDWRILVTNDRTGLYFGKGSPEQGYTQTISTLSLNRWYHIGVVNNGTTVKFYLDGVEVGTTTMSGNLGISQTQFRIGRTWGTHYYFNGYIDEVRVSDTARSADWILTEYNNQSAPYSFYSVSNEIHNWKYVRTITVDKTKVSGTVGDFPMLISGTYSYLATTANGGKLENSSGYDLAFYSDPDLTNQLAHEVEIHNTTTGDVVIWVKVPRLSDAVDEKIYMAYGNSSVTLSLQSATNVWTNYTGVWHLSNGTTLSANGSTLTPYNGTLVGSPPAISGKIDGAASFDGSSQHINLGNNSAFDFGTGEFTIECWVYNRNAVGSSGNKQTYIGKGGNIDFDGGGWRFVYAYGFLFKVGSSSAGQVGAQTIAWNQDTWYHVVIRRIGNTAEIFINGVSDGTSNWTGVNADSSTHTMYFANNSSNQRAYGYIDEVRIRNGVGFSSEYILTTYNNQNSPSTFYSVGSETNLFQIKGANNIQQISKTGPATLITDGLVMYLDAGNTSSYSGSGTSWNDLSGNGYNATLVGSPTFTAATSTTPAYFTFDALSKYINFTNNATTRLANNYQTFSHWIWVTAYGALSGSNQFAEIWFSGNQYSTTSCGIALRPHHIQLVYGVPSWAQILDVPILSTSQAVTGQWMHVTVSIDRINNVIKLYINGVFQNQRTFNSFTVGTTYCRFGGNVTTGNSNDYFRGRLSMTTLYDRILSDSEILQNYYAHRSRFSSQSDPEVSSFVTSTSITDQTQINAINTLVSELKYYGLWSKMRAIYPMVGGNATAHAVNLKTPGTYNLTFSGTWTHSSTGADPDGTAAYADTSLNINTLTLNNTHISYYSREGYTTGRYEAFMGGFEYMGTGNVHRILQFTIDTRTANDYSVATTGYYGNNGGEEAALTGQATDSKFTQGLFIGSKTNSTDLRLFKNSTQLAYTSTNDSGALPNRNVWLGARNNPANAGGYIYCDKECAFASIGDGLTTAEVFYLNAVVTKFQRNLERDPDALAFISAASITDTTQRKAIHDLVCNLKMIGVWDKLVFLYPYVGGTSTSHSYNLKNPSQYQITWTGSPSHTSAGVTFNGSTQYGNTGFAPSNTYNNSAAMGGIRSSWSSEGYIMGSDNGTSSPGFYLYAMQSYGYEGRIGYLSSLSVLGGATTPISNTGFYSATRNSSDAYLYYNTEVKAYSTRSTTSNSNSLNILVGGFNYNGTIFYSGGVYTLHYFSTYLTPTEVYNLNQVIQLYQETLGRRVY